MRKIYLEDIDLSELKPINNQEHKESILFHDDKTIYKLFDDLEESKLKRKQQKIELLGDGLPLPSTIMPTSELFYCFPFETFQGYGMDYKKETETFYQKFSNNIKNEDLIEILKIISHTLMEIHKDPRNIIISDLHARNIIVDSRNNPYFIDIDSCKIDRLKNDTIPLMLKQYLLKRNLFTSIESFETTPNTDRLCFLIMLLNTVFKKSFDRITLYEYDEKTEHIEILKDLRSIITLLKISPFIPEIPYLHEIPSLKRELKRI